MKRAEVFKHRADQVWIVEVWGEGPFYRRDGFPTHAEALAHALAEVGLDRPAEHREAP